MDVLRASDRQRRQGPAEWFTGEVWLEPVVQAAAPARVQVARVTFAPGARTAWHTHPLGQTLHVLAGRARIGRDDGTVEQLATGDSVWFAPGERHWHGATPDAAMTHLAIQEADEHGQAAAWAEHVTDEQYGPGTAAPPAGVAREQLMTAAIAGRFERIEAHRVVLPPGQAAGRHLHEGGVVGYVEEGEIAFAVEGEAERTLTPGDVFHEPPGTPIARFDNASPTDPARFVAYYPLAGDQQPLTPLD